MVVPSLRWITPSCRSVLVVGTWDEPSLMEPLAELEEMQVAMVLTPSAASIAGASTGQRLNGAQWPFN